VFTDGTTFAIGSFSPGSLKGTSAAAITASSTFTGAAQGGTSTPFRTVQPTILVTTYIKL
jgi:hypothetical protein